jgi:hypothetical protein
VTEVVTLPGVAAGQAVDLLTGAPVATVNAAGELTVELAGYAGRAVVFRAG